MAELTNDQSGALSTYYECTLRVVNISTRGKDAVISRSGKDNNRPTLEEYLSQLIPCLPRVSMCSLHTAAHEPEPNVQAAHLLHAAHPQEPPRDNTLWRLLLSTQGADARDAFLWKVPKFRA